MSEASDASASLVTVFVSDPWSFPDENEGRLGFVASIVGKANGHWVLRFVQPITYKGIAWTFAIPVTRHVGQRYFDDPEETDRSANIAFISDEQAQSQTFLRSYDRLCGWPGKTWVIGSVERGIRPPIREGEVSYTEPRWHPRDDSSPR